MAISKIDSFNDTLISRNTNWMLKYEMQQELLSKNSGYMSQPCLSVRL